MQCTMLPKIDYLDKHTAFKQQQEAVMTKIRQMSKSHIIHPGLPQFQPGAPANVTVDPKDIPGLRELFEILQSAPHQLDIQGETGWSPDMAVV